MSTAERREKALAGGMSKRKEGKGACIVKNSAILEYVINLGSLVR